MANVNMQIIIGRLGKDPEIRYMASGDPVANFSVAVSEKYKNKSGEQKELTEWFNVVIFKGAENMAMYLKKGSQVYVQGKTRTEEHDGKKYRKLIADRVVFLDGKKTEETPVIVQADDNEVIPF